MVRGLQDPEALVRGQAAFALGQLAEYCQPDINEHYKELLPGVFHVMHDPTPQVQQQACYALDAFCENLGRSSCWCMRWMATHVLQFVRTTNLVICLSERKKADDSAVLTRNMARV